MYGAAGLHPKTVPKRREASMRLARVVSATALLMLIAPTAQTGVRDRRDGRGRALTLSQYDQAGAEVNGTLSIPTLQARPVAAQPVHLPLLTTQDNPGSRYRRGKSA